MGNFILFFQSLFISIIFSSLFSRLLTSAPLITDNALLVLKRYCQDEVNEDLLYFVKLILFFCLKARSYLGMNTLRDMIFRRMNMRDKFLDILLDFTHNENLAVRNNAIRIAKSLHEKEEFKQSIEVRIIRVDEFNRNVRFVLATCIEIFETFNSTTTTRSTIRRREKNVKWRYMDRRFDSTLSSIIS